MSMESGCAEAVVLTQGLERRSVGDQKLHAADIAIAGAPLKQRYAVFVSRSRRVTRSDEIKHQICAAVSNLIKYVFGHMAM